MNINDFISILESAESTDLEVQFQTTLKIIIGNDSLEMDEQEVDNFRHFFFAGCSRMMSLLISTLPALNDKDKIHAEVEKMTACVTEHFIKYAFEKFMQSRRSDKSIYMDSKENPPSQN